MIGSCGILQYNLTRTIPQLASQRCDTETGCMAALRRNRSEESESLELIRHVPRQPVSRL